MPAPAQPSPANTNPSTNTTAGTSLDKDLIELEERYWNALKDKDIDSMLALTYNPCIITGAQGVGRVDHQTFRAMMTNAKRDVVDFTLSDMTTLRLTEDVAVVAYRVSKKLNVEGSPIALEAADASTWMRQNGKWLCAVHTESLIGDPYGRDRGERDA